MHNVLWKSIRLPYCRYHPKTPCLQLSQERCGVLHSQGWVGMWGPWTHPLPHAPLTTTNWGYNNGHIETEIAANTCISANVNNDFHIKDCPGNKLQWNVRSPVSRHHLSINCYCFWPSYSTETTCIILRGHFLGPTCGCLIQVSLVVASIHYVYRPYYSSIKLKYLHLRIRNIIDGVIIWGE